MEVKDEAQEREAVKEAQEETQEKANEEAQNKGKDEAQNEGKEEQKILTDIKSSPPAGNF